MELKVNLGYMSMRPCLKKKKRRKEVRWRNPKNSDLSKWFILFQLFLLE